MSDPQDDIEESTQHRIIGMVIVRVRCDKVADGFESDQDHKENALQEIADELGVDVTACQWADFANVTDTLVPEE